MAVNVSSEVTRLRERLRASRDQSEQLRIRLQQPSAPETIPAQPRYMDDDGAVPSYSFGADTRVSRVMLNRILADVLRKPSGQAAVGKESLGPGSIPFARVKDITPVV